MARAAGRRAHYGSRHDSYRHSVGYIDGNVVRKLSPDIEEQQEEEKRQERLRRQDRIRRHNNAVRRNQENALRMDLPYLIMLTVATIAALFICCSYIHVQASITTSMRNIETQEKTLENLKSENDALQTSINTDVDLDHIYDVATRELGMVYANKDQVIKYKKTESEYVRQYEDIPGEAGK
jgi:cell division protein FtsL